MTKPIGPHTTLGELADLMRARPLSVPFALKPGGVLSYFRGWAAIHGIPWQEPETPAPVEPDPQLSLALAGRTGCRLELKLLAPTDACGACGQPADTHRFYWHHTHR